MKRVAILQSSYIPWKGYFDIVAGVDQFVFYDDVQYTKHDWRNRNRIKTTQGCAWLTIPVGERLDRRICDVEMASSHWQKKHFRSLQQHYARTPYFRRYESWLEDVYLGSTWTHLSALNQSLIQSISGKLGFTTAFVDSRDYQLAGDKNQRLLNLLESLQATHYISGPAARDYLDMAAFAAAGIEVQWMEYSGYPEYNQVHPPFAHDVTVLDVMFHTGDDAAHFIHGWRTALTADAA